MIKWIKKVFGIAELIDERKKTNELLKMILDENKSCLLYTSPSPRD